MRLNKEIKKESRGGPVSGDPDSFLNRQPIALLKPNLDKGKSVLKSLQQRKTIREISDKQLSLQTLSNLLWAACGVNRIKGPFGIPGRTAATASDSQEIDLYVAMYGY
jgi:hypothetical protein